MLFIALILIGELCRTSGFIDIPTIPEYDIPGMYGGSVMFSVPIWNKDPYPNDDHDPDPKDFTVAFRYGFAGRGEISLAMYTPNTYALNISYLLKKENGNAPALFGGVDDISYSTHLSTIGRKDDVGYLEERAYHLDMGGRPPELFSAYIGMQKSFAEFFNMVIGLGRGRFVGYGKRSHLLNTDLLVLGKDYATKEHSWWAFGVFFGASMRFPFGLELIAEIDGRDGNAGIKYHHKYFTTTFALTKVEHFGDVRPYSPRITFGLETNNRFMLGDSKVGSVECTVRDIASKEPLSHSIVIIKELNKRYDAKGATFSMSLPAGKYTLTVRTHNYEDYVARISVKPDLKSKLIFDLKKTQEALKKEAALREKDMLIKTYFEQGKTSYSDGNLDEARSAFEMVISLDPDHQGAKGYLANIEPRRVELIGVYGAEARSRTQANDLIEAIEYWLKVLDLDADNTEAKTAINNLQKQIAAEKKPPKKTEPPVVKETAKAKIDALYMRGVFHFTAEQYDEALKLFNQVLILDPNYEGAKEYKTRTEARIKILQGGG